jgi:hypothetical protein
VDISVHSELGADSYFSIPQFDPLVGWQKAWFLLKNETNVPFPMFTGGRPVPHSNWEYGAARTDLPRLQAPLEIVQGLLQKGLTGQVILWTFLNCRFQPLH